MERVGGGGVYCVKVSSKKGSEIGSLSGSFGGLSDVSYYSGIAREGADFGGEGVEVVEAAVVAVGRHSGNGTHGVEIPWGQYQQAAAGAGLETLALGFPIGTDGLFLQMYQRIALL